jgi:hypothetical protein
VGIYIQRVLDVDEDAAPGTLRGCPVSPGPGASFAAAEELGVPPILTRQIPDPRRSSSSAGWVQIAVVGGKACRANLCARNRVFNARVPPLVLRDRVWRAKIDSAPGGRR